MKEWVWAIIGFVISCAVIYGMYWLMKTASYHIFYEDMVIQTIKETVNIGSLK